MSDAGGVVQLHDGVESRQPRCNHLRSTAKTCEKVRFYKTCRDLEITFHPSAIQQYAHATPRFTGVNQRRHISCIMTNDAAAPGKLRPQHAFNFFGVIAAVSSGGNQNRHVLEPHTGQFRKQRFEHRLPGLRARDVADRDGNPLPRPSKFPQRRFAERLTQSRYERAALIRRRRNVDRFDHRGSIVGKFGKQTRSAVVETQLHCVYSVAQFW